MSGHFGTWFPTLLNPTLLNAVLRVFEFSKVRANSLNEAAITIDNNQMPAGFWVLG